MRERHEGERRAAAKGKRNALCGSTPASRPNPIPRYPTPPTRQESPLTLVQQSSHSCYSYRQERILGSARSSSIRDPERRRKGQQGKREEGKISTHLNRLTREVPIDRGPLQLSRLRRILPREVLVRRFSSGFEYENRGVRFGKTAGNGETGGTAVRRDT
jgi:hypothetical protein